MGKGDKKTRKGKISSGSYGKTRPSRPIVERTKKANLPKKAE